MRTVVAYLVESTLLASLYWVSLLIMHRSLECRLFSRRASRWRLFGWTLLLVLACNIVATELQGPDAIWLHQGAVFAFACSIGLLLVVQIGRLGRKRSPEA